MGGMIAVVVLALMMVPVFFVVVQAAFDKEVRRELKGALRSRLRAARRMKVAARLARGAA